MSETSVGIQPETTITPAIKKPVSDARDTNEEKTLPLNEYEFTQPVGKDGEFGLIEVKPRTLMPAVKQIKALEMSFLPSNYTGYPIEIGLVAAPIAGVGNSDDYRQLEGTFLKDIQEKYNNDEADGVNGEKPMRVPSPIFLSETGREMYVEGLPSEKISHFTRELESINIPQDQKRLISLMVLNDAIHSLQYLHKLGIYHRDPNMGNILISTRDLSVNIVDFDSAKMSDSPVDHIADIQYFFDRLKDTGTFRNLLPDIDFSTISPENAESLLKEKIESLGENHLTKSELAKKYFHESLRYKIETQVEGKIDYTDQQLEEVVSAVEVSIKEMYSNAPTVKLPNV